MLHSALPRAFLPPPGLCYLSGYYGETISPYSAVSRYLPLENNVYINNIPENNHELSRVPSPCPLDLSVKQTHQPSLPPPPPSLRTLSEPPTSPSPRPLDVETIDVDEPEENDYKKEKKYNHTDWDSRIGLEDRQQTPPPRSFIYNDSYNQEPVKSLGNPVQFTSEITQDYASPISSPVLNQKLLIPSSPESIRSLQTYQQQLMLTPQHNLHDLNGPMTPPSTPSPPQCPRRRQRPDDDETTSPITPTKSPNITTGIKPLADKLLQRPKKKHARRLKFDEDTSSPVSGTVILGPDEAVVTGDIDPAFNIVEVTDEARAELAKIENRLGPYQCKLCRHLHDDAFQLAQHRCSRIAHVEYRCPECDKRFSCPANLASHRRWHKPRLTTTTTTTSESNLVTTPSTSGANVELSCGKCDAKFGKQAALKKHLATQHSEANNNNIIVANGNSRSSSNGSSSSSSSSICVDTSNDGISMGHVGGGDGMQTLWMTPHSTEMA